MHIDFGVNVGNGVIDCCGLNLSPLAPQMKVRDVHAINL